MKKPLEKKKIRSAHYGIKVLFDHSAQYPAAGFEDERTDHQKLELTISPLILIG